MASIGQRRSRARRRRLDLLEKRFPEQIQVYAI